MRGCETHKNIDHDCVECWQSGFTKALTPIFCVTDSMSDRPASEILLSAAKLAEKMEEIQASKEREWGIALAAEAVFDLVTVDKNPLPTDFALVNPEDEEVFLPALIGPIVGRSNSDVRRLLTEGGVKLDGEKITSLKVPAALILKKTLVIGKQGRAIFCHAPFQTINRRVPNG